MRFFGFSTAVNSRKSIVNIFTAGLDEPLNSAEVSSAMFTHFCPNSFSLVGLTGCMSPFLFIGC